MSHPCLKQRIDIVAQSIFPAISSAGRNKRMPIFLPNNETSRGYRPQYFYSVWLSVPPCYWCEEFSSASLSHFLRISFHKITSVNFIKFTTRLSFPIELVLFFVVA